MKVCPSPLPFTTNIRKGKANADDITVYRKFMARMSLDPRFDTECGPDEEAYTSVSGIIACYNYLNSM